MRSVTSARTATLFVSSNTSGLLGASGCARGRDRRGSSQPSGCLSRPRPDRQDHKARRHLHRPAACTYHRSPHEHDDPLAHLRLAVRRPRRRGRARRLLQDGRERGQHGQPRDLRRRAARPRLHRRAAADPDRRGRARGAHLPTARPLAHAVETVPRGRRRCGRRNAVPHVGGRRDRTDVDRCDPAADGRGHDVAPPHGRRGGGPRLGRHSDRPRQGPLLRRPRRLHHDGRQRRMAR